MISVAGVAVATAAIVIVLSVFNGFSDIGHHQLSVLDPDLKITPRTGKVIQNADSLTLAISHIPGIIAAEPVLEERGLLMAGSAQVPVVFKGVNIGYPAVVSIDSVADDGVFAVDSLLGFPTANLAIGVAYHAGITPSADRTVRLYVPRRQGRINPANPTAAFRGDTLLIRSILRSDVQEFDADRVIVPLAVARRLLDYDTQASAIEIAVSPGTDISQIQAHITQTYPGLKVENRLQQQSEAFRMIAIEKWITFLMLVFVLIIAAFNVISTLSLIVVEKRNDMEIFAFLGANRSRRSAIYIWQAWLISMIGSMIGIVFGCALSLIQQFFHIVRLNASEEALTINYYPVRLSGNDVLIVLLVTAAVAFLTAQTTRLMSTKDANRTVS